MEVLVGKSMKIIYKLAMTSMAKLNNQWVPSGKHLHNYGKSPRYQWEKYRHFDWAMASIAM